VNSSNFSGPTASSDILFLGHRDLRPFEGRRAAVPAAVLFRVARRPASGRRVGAVRLAGKGLRDILDQLRDASAAAGRHRPGAWPRSNTSATSASSRRRSAGRNPLSGAVLAGADLRGTILDGAHLSNADLRGAIRRQPEWRKPDPRQPHQRLPGRRGGSQSGTAGSSLRIASEARSRA
jgi:hypothetical protein